MTSAGYGFFLFLLCGSAGLIVFAIRVALRNKKPKENQILISTVYGVGLKDRKSLGFLIRVDTARSKDDLHEIIRGYPPDRLSEEEVDCFIKNGKRLGFTSRDWHRVFIAVPSSMAQRCYLEQQVLAMAQAICHAEEK